MMSFHLALKHHQIHWNKYSETEILQIGCLQKNSAEYRVNIKHTLHDVVCSLFYYGQAMRTPTPEANNSLSSIDPIRYHSDAARGTIISHLLFSSLFFIQKIGCCCLFPSLSISLSLYLKGRATQERKNLGIPSCNLQMDKGIQLANDRKCI